MYVGVGVGVMVRVGVRWGQGMHTDEPMGCI